MRLRRMVDDGVHLETYFFEDSSRATASLRSFSPSSMKPASAE